MIRSRCSPALVFLGLLLVAAGAVGESMEWAAHADQGTVKVVTIDEDGSERETKIWLAVVDGQGYIRTGGTRWGKNVQRNPDVVLRIGEQSLPLRAEFVADESVRERVTAAFREKYGWSDRLISPFRGGDPLIMRLHARTEGGAQAP